MLKVTATDPEAVRQRTENIYPGSPRLELELPAIYKGEETLKLVVYNDCDESGEFYNISVVDGTDRKTEQAKVSVSSRRMPHAEFFTTTGYRIKASLVR